MTTALGHSCDKWNLVYFYERQVSRRYGNGFSNGDRQLLSRAAITPDKVQVTDPAPTVANSTLPTATIISVGDGDMLRMDYQGENVTVRFACIDAV
ncbi:hypothetical protein ACQ4N7_29965 [Nodosilinea sp. AN01ver1]|uniref:hypothetical protein n=1 Tax=Nodosilinea sp. AN01ver1 TaxID=3423362 RepID=UPI003D31214B